MTWMNLCLLIRLLLGKWIKDAKSWGTGEEEKRLYEKNARDLVTLWGGKEAFYMIMRVNNGLVFLKVSIRGVGRFY
ncbi:MAG: hypothetical protein EP145_05445 [Bacteroides uniformis]|nr:hypothetical protein [Bacteroides uniformis]